MRRRPSEKVVQHTTERKPRSHRRTSPVLLNAYRFNVKGLVVRAFVAIVILRRDDQVNGSGDSDINGPHIEVGGLIAVNPGYYMYMMSSYLALVLKGKRKK